MLEVIISTILIATFLNIFLKKFRIPTIIGYIITGIIIAYGFEYHDKVHSHELKEIAEFGVVFLMFTIGLEFSVKQLIRMKKQVFLYGGMQVMLTALIFTFVAHYLLDIEIKSSIIIGFALALSSTAIVLKLLKENGEINQPYGQKVLGILLFQDIAVIPILLMITIFSTQNGSIYDLLFMTLVKMIILLVGSFIAGKYLLDIFLTSVSKTKSDEIFMGSILLIVIGSSYIAHILGFSYSLGAFISGMMIADTKYRHQIESDLIPFRDLLLGVFFITVGMQLNFTIIANNLSTISMLLPAIILIKIAIIYSIFIFNSSSKTTLKIALSIFQLGEFALVIFELSFARGLLDATVGQVLIISVILSMIITPFVLNNLSKIAYSIIPSPEQDPKQNNTDNLENHIIVIGYGKLGKYLTSLIKEKGWKFIAVELDIQIVKKAQQHNIPVVFGNASKKHILKSVNIEKASSILISIGDSQKIYHICETLNSLNLNAKTIVKVNKFKERRSLAKLKLSHIIVETEKTAHTMIEEAMRHS